MKILNYLPSKLESKIPENRVPTIVPICPPPNTNDPILLLSFRGIHIAKRALNAGNVVPSPNPSKNRRIIKAVGPPSSIVIG